VIFFHEIDAKRVFFDPNCVDKPETIHRLALGLARAHNSQTSVPHLKLAKDLLFSASESLFHQFEQDPKRAEVKISSLERYVNNTLLELVNSYPKGYHGMISRRSTNK
jgi:hypothetical protein